MDQERPMFAMRTEGNEPCCAGDEADRLSRSESWTSGLDERHPLHVKANLRIR